MDFTFDKEFTLTINDTTAIQRAYQHARDTDSVNDLACVMASFLTWTGKLEIRADREHDLFFIRTYDDGSKLCGGIIYHATSNTWGVHT